MISGILPSLVSHKARFFEAATDSEGVEPTALDALLSNWSTSSSTKDSPFPKFLYTTPTGANPSGTTASDDRKRAVLAVAGKHNLLLLEDDPYYFLSFKGLSAVADPVTRVRGKSYFQLEAEDNYVGGVGRVLRFDSFSKILSAGLRLGFVTGPKEILDAIDLDTSSRNLQTSGTSQAIAYALLSKWGIDGFLKHADNVAKFYQVSTPTASTSATATSYLHARFFPLYVTIGSAGEIRIISQNHPSILTLDCNMDHSHSRHVPLDQASSPTHQRLRGR